MSAKTTRPGVAKVDFVAHDAAIRLRSPTTRRWNWRPASRAGSRREGPDRLMAAGAGRARCPDRAGAGAAIFRRQQGDRRGSRHAGCGAADRTDGEVVSDSRGKSRSTAPRSRPPPEGDLMSCDAPQPCEMGEICSSTRRFWERPDSLALEAIGSDSPLPSM